MRKFSIKDWANDDQPRQKLLVKGVKALSNAELLAILINTGTINQSALDIAQQLLITLGGRGAYVQNGSGGREVSGYPVRAIDTNGAGDIFAGATLWALCNGHEIEHACAFANRAAARLVTRMGARLPFPEYAELRASWQL